ncbi:MAG: PRK06851 family protein [Clostridia bacterium]
MAGRIRKMFPGGNTSQGFYSYYRYILPEDANRVFIIKGGPGVGKSDFMKKITREMTRLGFGLEHHYCSSDNDSLDAIVIEDLKIALLDGTAPHMVDPKYPGAFDEIINFGEFWDVKALERHKDSIIKLSRRKTGHFTRAYRLLAAAKLVMDDVEEKYRALTDNGRANQVAEVWADEIFDGWPVSLEPGKERHLFASAYTPGGYVDYSDTLIENVQRVYHVEGGPGTGKTHLLGRLARKAIDRGVRVEYFHFPLKPHKLHTIVLDELGIAVTCGEGVKARAARSVDLNSFLHREEVKTVGEYIKRDNDLYRQLISEAVSAINDAKSTHDMLEEYYIDNMDFRAVNNLRDRVLERILEYR